MDIRVFSGTMAGQTTYRVSWVEPNGIFREECMKTVVGNCGKTYRIVVADDHPLFREALVQLITQEEDLICCAETDSAHSTHVEVTAHKPDLLLLDLRLRDGDALDLIKTLRIQFPSLLILVLSQHDEGLYAERVLRAGAKGYVMKQEVASEVRSAIRAILNGQLHVSRKMSIIALHRLIEARPGSGATNVDALSDRELQVFQLLGAGRSTRQVAEQLHINFKTVETYRENLKHKLGLPDAASLVHYATQWVQGEGREQPNSNSRVASPCSPRRSLVAGHVTVTDAPPLRVRVRMKGR